MRIVFGLLTIAAMAVSTANAGSVLGINSVANGGGIYVIDTDTGVATLLESTAGAALGSSINSGNGLAQGDNGVIYYSSFGAAENDTLFASAGGGPVAAGTLEGNVASGTFGGGSFWYIAQNSPNLHQVTFNGSGTSIVSDTATLLTGDVNSWSFGDIAASGSTIYGVAITGGGQELFSIDLNTFTVTTIASVDVNLQIAFSGSELIGLNSTTGNIYSVDLTTGALTFKSTVTSATGETLRINDLGSFSGPVIPEPTSMALLGIGLTGLLSVRRFLSRTRLA